MQPSQPITARSAWLRKYASRRMVLAATVPSLTIGLFMACGQRKTSTSPLIPPLSSSPTPTDSPLPPEETVAPSIPPSTSVSSTAIPTSPAAFPSIAPTVAPTAAPVASAAPTVVAAPPAASPASAAPGRGQIARGSAIFSEMCSGCHGTSGAGQSGFPTLAGKNTLAHFGSAKNLFDYIKTAMPQDRPGSLSQEEYYALTAYLLTLNSVNTDGKVTVGPDTAATLSLK